METVPDRSAATLTLIIISRVKPGITIITDNWHGYNRLAVAGFTHLTVSHKYNIMDLVSGAHTQHIERV
jgi:transposase-like protein